MNSFASLEELRAWCERAPEGTTLPAHAIGKLLADLVDLPAPPAPSVEGTAEASWRERLWTVPAETRLGAADVAEALGKSLDWVYRRTRSSAEAPLPHRKLDGALVFTAGDVRSWIAAREELEVGPPPRGPRLVRHHTPGGAR